MLTTLLESGPHQTRTSHFMTASATVHAAIIFLAVYATAMGAAAKDKPNDPAVIHWVPMPKPHQATSTPLPDHPQQIWSVLPASAPLAVSIEVPSTLPRIDLELVPATSDFERNATGNPNAPDRSPAVNSTGNAKGYYNLSEVETAVAFLGNTAPEYPSALRASGIEGIVAAEFVVTASGRADVGSLRIISATNEAFVESVRRALPRMRFRPATIGGQTVAQLVQQQFVFRLDH